ncbi:MAG: hypothetical protein Q9163_006521 [Psora crenata]
MNIEPANVKSRRRSPVYSHESLEQLEGSVEAYQASKSTMRSPIYTPMHDEVMRLGRKKTNTNSETGSRASAHSKGSRGSRADSDVKTRKSLDRRSSNNASMRNENDRFALHFNPDCINVKMQGDIEAINLRKSKDYDGDIELTIGSQPSIEARGRALGNRPPLREKSRTRYPYLECQGVKELENSQQESSRAISRARVEPGDEDEPRVVGERIITRTRSRRSSKYRDERGGEQGSDLR